MRVEPTARFQILSLGVIGTLLWTLIPPEAPGQFPSDGSAGRSLRMKIVEPTPVAPSPAATPATPAAPLVEPPQRVKVETLSFLGVRIGASSIAEAAAAWGQPVQSNERETVTQQTFSVEPFDRIDATFYRGVILSATIHLRDSLPLDDVAAQLELSTITPVALRDLNGRISGRAYPERGCSLLFASAADRTVRQIILDTIDAPPFVQRAEQHLAREPSLALLDAQTAVKVDDRSSRAWRMLGVAQMRLGQHADAVNSAERAKELEPDQPPSHLLLAAALHSAGQRQSAELAAQAALKLSADRPEWKVAALVCAGEMCVDGSVNDSQRALNYFQQAVTAADALRSHSSIEVRKVAGEALIAAHLGAADAISRGQWQNRPQAVSRWLEQTVKLIQESYAEQPDLLADAAFEVGVKATEIATRLDGQLDVRSWAEDCRALADQRLAGVTHPADRHLITRDLVRAYDHVAQSAQRRREADVALKYAEQGLALWQEALAQTQISSDDKYLLGQLNFRVGSCHALLKQDHAQAVAWFDKARTDLDAAASTRAKQEAGKLGESLVSMAVSYWSVGQHQAALDLTERGVEWMEQAVEQGQLERTALKVPFNNLAKMHQNRGNSEQAEKFTELASKLDGKTTR